MGKRRSRRRSGIDPKLRALAEDQGWRCWWCGEAMLDVEHRHPKRATIEHLTPKFSGGGNETSNLRAACHACNNRRCANAGPPVWRS